MCELTNLGKENFGDNDDDEEDIRKLIKPENALQVASRNGNLEKVR